VSAVATDDEFLATETLISLMGARHRRIFLIKGSLAIRPDSKRILLYQVSGGLIESIAGLGVLRYLGSSGFEVIRRLL